MRNKKLAILLHAIFFVELAAIHLIDASVYYGVIKTWLFDIVMIPLLLGVAFIKEFGKGKIIGFIGLLVFIPLIFIFNLPSTTYEDGKAIVHNKIISDEVTFISTDYHLIPTASLKSWFIDDYYYHYEVEVSGETLYYAVSPINGFSFQLEEDFFRYTR